MESWEGASAGCGGVWNGARAEGSRLIVIERDFYRDNCHRQARFGLMVNSLFG